MYDNNSTNNNISIIVSLYDVFSICFMISSTIYYYFLQFINSIFILSTTSSFNNYSSLFLIIFM